METQEKCGHPDRELYALLHLSHEASDDDIKRAYRQWAQVYHPDKHQTPQMQDIATKNFQKIQEAYDVLSDEQKRQIYDLYGMEGLASGLELGPKLKSKKEVRAQLERLHQREEERRLAAHMHHRGFLFMNLSMVPFLKSYDPPKFSGMAMSTQVQAKVSKQDFIILGGNMALRRGLGGGSITMVLRRQLSPISTIELVTMVGLRSILSLQTSRQLSSHSTGTLGLSISLRDGSLTLANTWSRQLSEDTTGNIQLIMGPNMGLSVGWQGHGVKNACSADVKVRHATIEVSCQYTRHFSSKSQGQFTGKFGSAGIDVELGGERKISEHSSAAMFCVLGLQGVFWKIRFIRRGQTFVIPIMLCTTLNPFVAIGALIIPSSIYTIIKNFVYKPYNLRKNRQKSIELRQRTYLQAMEARVSSEKSQLLLKNIAIKKNQKQVQQKGLVILAAVYGDIKAYEQRIGCMDNFASTKDDDTDLLLPYLDVVIPIQFLINDHGQLQLHKGIKKAGLMGFFDPCPNESKQLKVAYSYLGYQYEVVVGDYDELQIPQEAHRIQLSTSKNYYQASLSNLYCKNPLYKSNSKLVSPKFNGEKLEEQCSIKTYIDQHKTRQSNIKASVFENRKIQEAQEPQDFYVQCKLTKVEGVKYVNQVNFANKLKKSSLQGGPLQRLCNYVPNNAKFNETFNFQEVHKFLFRKEDVQSVVSIEEMYQVIIELVVSLHTIVAQCQNKNLNTKTIAEFIVNKLGSSLLTYEHLIMGFLMENLSNKKISLFKVTKKYNVLKIVTINSISKNLKRWLNKAQRIGLGWILIDNNAIGFPKDSIQAWLVALIFIYEAQCNVKLSNKVDFKFEIDEHTIANSHSTICKVMLELLCNPILLSYISIAKWKSEDQQWHDFFSHKAKTIDSKNLLHQLVALCKNGLNAQDCHLNVTFIKCHHMAFNCSIIYRSIINILKEQFCCWCTITRKSQCVLTINHDISTIDTTISLCSIDHMQHQLLMELKSQIECWISWSAKNSFRCYSIQLGNVAISMNKANFPSTTPHQVFCLFKTFFKEHIKKKSKNKPLQILKELYILKNNHIQDVINKEFLNTTKKYLIQKNANAYMKIQNKADSYHKQYESDFINNKIPTCIQILCMEEVSQSNNCKNLSNNHIGQVDSKFLNKQLYQRNGINSQDKKKIMDNDNKCLDFINSILLEIQVLNDNLQGFMEGQNLIDKDNNLQKKFNRNSTSSIKDRKQNILIQHCNLKKIGVENKYKQIKNLDVRYPNYNEDEQNIEYIQDNYSKTKTKQNDCKNVLIDFLEKSNDELQVNSLHSMKSIAMETSLVDLFGGINQSFDIVHNEQLLNDKHSLQSVTDENSQGLLPSNTIEKIDNLKESMHSNIEDKEDKFLKVSRFTIPNKTLQKSKILQPQDCSSIRSMIDLKGNPKNIFKKEPHVFTKEFGKKIKNDLNLKNGKTICTKFHGQKDNIPKKKLLCQDQKLKTYNLETNLKVLQCFIEDSQSILKFQNTRNDQIDQLKNKNNLECITSKDLHNKNDKKFNKFFVMNCNKEKNETIECLDQIPFKIEPCMSKDDQQLCGKFNKNAMIDKEPHVIPHLQIKKSIDHNVFDMYSLKSRNETNDFATDYVNNLISSNSFQSQETILLHKSNKNISKSVDDFEFYSSLNSKNYYNNNDLFATNTSHKVVDNDNNTTYDECESSLSQSYSITPEDGGILRNKKNVIDDVIQNENSLKLKSFEKSLNSLYEKSCTYKNLHNMKRTSNRHNPLKTSIPPHNSSSTSIKYNVKVNSTKIDTGGDTLYPCNPYPFLKQDSKKEKNERLYPHNPYSYKTDKIDINQLNSKSKEVESKNLDQSTKQKFQQHVSQPLYAMKKETIKLSSPKKNSYLNYNEVDNNESLSKFTKSKSNIKYSNNCQSIEDDKILFEHEKTQFLHNEYEDVRNELFVPFVFDDARFFLSSKHCSIQLSNASGHEEQERISSNVKKTISITADNCTISSNSLQCQETPIRLPMANQEYVLQNNSDYLNHNDYRNHHQLGHEVIKICHYAQDASIERIEGDITLQTTPSKKMKKNISIENGKPTTKNTSKGESSHTDEKYCVKEGYGKPCCCDPFLGHTTTCYQYVPNYEPPEVTKIKKTSILDNPRLHMNYDEQCHQQFIAMRKAQLSISNSSDHVEQQLNILRRTNKYGSNQLQSYRNVNEGEANLESKLSEKTNVGGYVAKGCEYDRIGRYRKKSETSKSKSRQQWKKN